MRPGTVKRVALYIPWLADAARLTGYPVVEVDGWRTRGHGQMVAVEGVVAHHTAGPASGDFPSLRVVRDGHSSLSGPLSHLGLGRTGTIHVIAAGLCYHAGQSAWAGYTSLNSRFIGIEAESVGTRDDWTDEQRDCYPRLCAALLHFMRRPASRLAGHKEVAPKRKIDPAFWDMGAMRARVAHLLEDPLNRIPGHGGSEVALSDDQVAQLRKDVGFARDQILTRLGVADPVSYPTDLEPDELEDLEPARQVDLAHAVAELRADLTEIKELLHLPAPVQLTVDDVDRLAQAVSRMLADNIGDAVVDELARRVVD